MVIVIFAVALLIWLGYQYGRDKTGGDENKTAEFYSPYPSAAKARKDHAADRKLRLAQVSSDTAAWLAKYLGECESPAEESLLRAIVTEYALVPQMGVLKGAGLALQLQVDEGPYRNDFLANGWLVIEVDGDAYHASPEQVRRDKARDMHLESRGYTVLRIPAKTVFQHPAKALSDVRAALAVGRRPPPSQNPAPVVQTPRPPPANPLSAFARGLGAVGDGARRLNEFADSAQAVQSASAAGRQIFFEEKLNIDSAVEIANNKLALERYMGANPDQRDELTSILAELGAAVDSDSQSVAQPPKPVPKMVEPAAHPDPEIDGTIKRSHLALMHERAAYFQSIRDQIDADERLSSLVRAALIDSGHQAIWVDLTGSAGERVSAKPFK